MYCNIDMELLRFSAIARGRRMSNGIRKRMQKKTGIFKLRNSQREIRLKIILFLINQGREINSTLTKQVELLLTFYI